MWNMLKGNKERCMLPERGFKPLKVLLKIPKSRCADLERRDTSLLITKMARDFRNKIMVAEYVFSKILRGSVCQEGICNCICLHIHV
jgi:hypothetical protein